MILKDIIKMFLLFLKRLKKDRVYFLIVKLPKVLKPKKRLKKTLDKLISKKDTTDSVDNLLESCKRFIELKEKHKELVGLYRLSDDLSKRIRYDKHDLEDLSKMLPNENHLSLGLYFSALVNKIIQEDDVITLKFNYALSGIGAYLERGNLIIKGDVSSYTGWHMSGGKLIIEGNTSNMAGDFMEGGEIIIEGNAGPLLGHSMISGKIVIKGNAGDGVGCFMKGGEIHIEGKIDGVAGYNEGTIYHQGRLIHSSN